MKLLLKKLQSSFVFVAASVLAFNVLGLPACPPMPSAATQFSNVQSVTQSQGPAGYQLSQDVAGKDGTGVTTSYNFYSQTPYSPDGAVQQIHILGSLLNAPAQQDDYQQGGVEYRQCVYWNTMSGGIPSGNQVLSIQYSKSTVKFADNVIIFGDSLTDSCHRSTNNDPELGRRIWPVDFVAQAGLDSQDLSCWKDSGIDVVNGNIDFAIGGARVTGGNEQIDLQTQLNSYKTGLKANTPKPGTKFIIWMGGNDILGSDPNAPDDQAKQHMTDVVNQLISMVKDFVSSTNISANQVYIINMPIIGKAPGHQDSGYTRDAQYYNSALSQAVANYGGDAKPTIIDVYTPDEALYDYLTNPNPDPNSKYTKYHFDPKLAEIPCASVKKDPTACVGYLSWDGTHPTVMSHLFLSDSFIAALGLDQTKTGK